MSEAIIGWVDDWGPLVTLAPTIVLALITAWLAYLTKVMAGSAVESATHARVAAEATLSSLDVRFSVEPLMSSTAGELREALEILTSAGGMTDDSVVPLALFDTLNTWKQVRVTTLGATVNLHGLTVVHIGNFENDARLTTVRGASCSLDLASTESLPRLCHSGEAIEFEIKGRERNERLAEFRAVVRYSFGDGPVRERQVEWKQPEPASEPHEDGAVNVEPDRH